MVEKNQPDRLVVLWTSGDREVALKMVLMYTLNSLLRNWWSEVTLIIWGPSTQLLAGDSKLQEEVAKIKAAGGLVMSCKACTDSYGISEKLEELGVEVKYMGQPLTMYLKGDYQLISI